MAQNPQREKKTVERRCIGCGQRFEKRDLIRVVRTPEGTIELDFVGKKSGRGAYICPKAVCLRKARKAKRLETNLDCQSPEEIYVRLQAEIVNRGVADE